jgi:hypothetical protein
VNYFRARRAIDGFQEFERLSLDYWKALPPDNRGLTAAFGGSPRPQTSQSAQLRAQINRLIPRLEDYAADLGIPFYFRSAVAPQPISGFLAAVDRDGPAGDFDPQRVLDLAERCTGAAQEECMSAFWRLVLPPFWLITVPAFLIRVPFLILRAAGMPRSVEDNVWARLLKIAEVVALLYVLGRFGLQATPDWFRAYFGR